MKETFSHEFNSWQKFLQKTLGMQRINKESIDFKWGYFAPRFGFEFYFTQGGYSHAYWSVTFCFIWGLFNIRLPFKTKLGEQFDPPRYGMYLHESTLNFPRGRDRNKYWHLPWFSMKWEKSEAIYKDGTWGNGEYENKEHFKYESYPYVYTLENGQIQNRTAKCCVKRMQWKRKWFPFAKHVRTYIDIEFSDEVGERSGSWKGGCTGCSYDMLKDETMEQCLRRMESERKFR